MKKVLLILVVMGVVGFALLQLVPYGRDHTNPPVVSEPQWDSPATRQLAVEHCYQCHSNETEWPWYSNVAPASWLIYRDVDEARSEFNFSEWSSNPGELDDMIEEIEDGSMPPVQYWLVHPESRLSEAQKAQFIQGLQAALGGGEDGEKDDD